MASYSLVAIVKKKLELSQSMHEILQILSISLFDKTPVKQLFSTKDEINLTESSGQQVQMF